MFIFILKMLGLFLFVVNIYHSDAVEAVLGSNATLTCPFLPGAWNKEISGDWKPLTNGQKYANVNTAQLTIINVQLADSGNYLCNSRTDGQTFNLNVIVPVNGQWTDWSGWSTCSAKCGSGSWTKFRSCTNPPPTNGGSYCDGSDNQSESCFLKNCPVNGGWGDWGSWTPCSITCGGGISTRYRFCTKPAPTDGGTFCIGNANETESCNTLPCPALPDIRTTILSYNASIGGNITLDCMIVNSYPEVLELWWTDSRGSRLNTSRYSGGFSTNPLLTITGVLASDSGIYNCNARNSVGTSIASTKLFTGYAPLANIVFDHYVSRKGNVSLKIECQVTNGEKVSWFKNNITIQRNGKFDTGNINNSSIVINYVEPADRGVYKCYVENIYGSQSDETWLRVVHTEIPISRYENSANESVTLQCVIYDATELKWRHNDVIIPAETLRYSGGTTLVPSITITKLIRADGGVYQCESLYDYVTSISNEIILRIRDKPLVQSSAQSLQIRVGGEAVIPCSFDSYPESTNVFWKKDNMTLNSIDGIKYNGSSVMSPSLTIYNLNNSDNGIYVCYVKNDLGISSGTPVRLAVQDSLESLGILGPVAGGVSAGFVAVALVIVALFVCKKRRKLPKKTNARKNNKIVYEDESHVAYRQDTREEGMYINISRPSMLSSSETDEDSTVRTSLQQRKSNTENTYYNVDEITIVQVENLKVYIAKKKVNDGLKEDYKKIPYGMQHPTTKAELKENMPKNRFKTTFPYDHTRVILETMHGTNNSDYINANYVDGFEKDRCYIASQGPIKQTIQDHWRMILQNNTRKIVMLTNLVEGSKAKCDRYWPIGGKPMTFGNMVLTLASEKERAAYITREIYVEDKKTKEKSSVIQYHFTAWPDHGTPDPLYLVLFHKHFRADHNQIAGGPILVHCSAGIGRTGTFIALDALLEEGRTTGYVDIVKFVKKMRYCRMNMIQTADQYVCLHHALLEAFTMENTSIGKDQFGNFWREIQSDKRPINQQKLNEEFKKLNAKKSEHENVQYADATSAENIDKNRSKNVLAMDNTRLYLVTFEKGRSNYINAVQVPSYTKFVGYLTTQLPLPDTKVDFWTMIRDHSSSTIVLILNDLKEADLVYSASDDFFTCGPFSVKITRQERTENNITEASLIMTKKDEKQREIALFQTICKDRPNPQDLCRLYNLISTRISMSNEPVTVVSCDGAKNCGLFCTFVNSVSSMQIDAKADIFQLARLLQLRRPEFFSDFEEYRLCYEALNFYLESTNVYDNLTV